MNLRSIAMSLVILCSVAPVWAQLEPIGPKTLAPLEDFGTIWVNFIPPHADHKEFQFTGTASVPAGALSILQIDFDYLDSFGNTQILPAPFSPITVIGGSPMMIDSGIATVPFCPQIVSLHLKNLDSNVPIFVQGIFRHECIPLPEPSSLALAACGAAAVVGGALRRRPRRVRRNS